jgi:hypothetical protein
MKQKFILLSVLFGFLSACAQQTRSTPTPLPPNYLSTVVALTGQSAFATADALTPTAAITETPTPTQAPSGTPAPTSSLPSPTPTYEAGFTKFADLRFVSPGPMSSLTSPVNLKLLLTSGKSDLVKVDLLGEDGRMLYTDLLRVDHGQAGSYRNFDVEYETRAVSEKGYFRLSTKDQHGDLQALNTMPVLLYSIGDTQLNLPGNMIYERVSFKDLKNGSKIYDGKLLLKGRYWPFNKQPTFLDIILPDGKTLVTRELKFKGIDPEDFETSLPYKVTEPTLARLAIHQDNPVLDVIDPLLKKYIYFYSIEILLNP